MMYLTIEGLKGQFHQYGYPHWRVYQGKRCIGKFQNDETDFEEEELLDYSWMQLEELLGGYPAGKVNVQVKKNASDGNDRAITMSVQWGNPNHGYPSPTRSALGGVGIHPQVQPNGMQFWQMGQQMLQMQQTFFNQLMDVKLEKVKVENERDRAKEELEYAETPPIQMELLKEGIGVVKSYVAGLMYRPQAQLGTLGQKEPAEKIEVPPTQASATQQKGMSLDQAYQDVGTIAQYLPQYHVHDVMHALIQFIAEDPNRAILFIGPLIEKIPEDERFGH